MNKILVVDDDFSIRQLLQVTLQVEGYDVILAEDGKEALDKLEEELVDLVVLDLMLPKIDGWKVCRQLREDGNDIPIIMLTARDDEMDTILGLKIGADDYITKPFSPRELVARIEAVLRRFSRLEDSNNLLQYSGIMIDKIKRKVIVSKEEIELSPKEFDILWDLAEHPGQIFSREHLLDKVWGFDYIGTDRTVDVHIKRLRSKLEIKESAYRYIQTVWGVGYKFEVKEVE